MVLREVRILREGQFMDVVESSLVNKDWYDLLRKGVEFFILEEFLIRLLRVATSKPLRCVIF